MRIKLGIVFLFFMFCTASVVRAEEYQPYIVEYDDTFSQICSRFAKNGTKETYAKEAERLGIENPDLIYPGQILNFPALYRVTWKYQKTGAAGHGTWNPKKDIVGAFVKYGNNKYPSLMKHNLQKK